MIGILEGGIKTTTPSVNTNNLAVNFSFENTSGDVVDSHNGINGTISGTVTRGVEGVVGKAFYFNNGRVVVPHNLLFNLSNAGVNKNFAASFWIDSTQLPSSTNTWIFHKREFSSEYHFAYTNGVLQFRIWNTDKTTFDIQITTSIPSGKNHFSIWTDVANQTGGIGLNGVVLNTSIAGTLKTINAHVDPVTIGISPWNNYPLIGIMDELRIWTGAKIPSVKYLTTTEYNNRKGITL